ncbi:MAG: amidase [Acidimicrobiia bacterium]|nr:amidase [Acidimicrobiia bacterium]
MHTVVEVAEAVRTGERKATEVLEDCLDAVAARNEELNAFVHLDPDLAGAAAQAVDEAVARGDDPGPLAGVPFGVKDLEDCAGMPTSHGSLLYKGRPPVTMDSVHVRRLRAAGAVPVGKTAAPEFGITAFTHTKAWGTTRNPWDTSRTPGGSSGGSAAAVAAGLVPFSTASDGGGSTRIPAAFTGLVGLKPSYGRIPHERSSPSETACYGALTTTVGDAARHLDVAAGPDDNDRASLPASGIRFERAIEELDVTGLRAAWSPDMGYAVVVPEVADIARAAAEALCASASLEVVERPFRPTSPMRTWLAAGAADMWMGIEDGMWPSCADELTGLVRASLRRTQEWTLPRYARALRHRQRLEEEVADLFADVDVLLTPTTAMAAFAAEGPLPMEIDGQDASHAGPAPFTMLANVCWNPAISVPAGLTSDGLPVGLQITAQRHADGVALRLARILEQTRPWARLAPAPRPPEPSFSSSPTPPAPSSAPG